MKRLLIFLTNNGHKSRHETEFDMFFFIVNTLALIAGVFMLIKYGEPQWIPVLIIEYNWAWDNLRNNRG